MGKGNRNRPTSASGSVTEVRFQAAGTSLWVAMHVLTVPSLATKTPTSPIGGVLNQVFLNFASCGAAGGAAAVLSLGMHGCLITITLHRISCCGGVFAIHEHVDPFLITCGVRNRCSAWQGQQRRSCADTCSARQFQYAGA